MKRVGIARITGLQRGSTALRQKKRLPPRSRSTIASITRQLDKLWADNVKSRDLHTCRICGDSHQFKKYDAAHIMPRTRLATRFMLENGLCLCRRCHDYFHENPKLWEYVTPRLLPPGRYDQLYRLANTLLPSPPLSWYEEQRVKLLAERSAHAATENKE